MLNLWRKCRLNSNGHEAIEMVIMLPFLFAFLFGVVDFSSMFIKVERASNVAREGALQLERDCWLVPEENAQTCVEAVMEDMTLASGMYLILSIYGETAAFGFQRLAITGEAGEYVTKYEVEDFADMINGGNGFIVVGEVYYEHEGSTPLINMFEFDTTGAIYESIAM